MRFAISNRLIEPDDYIDLRQKCGLSERKIMAAIIGLPNSLCCISVLDMQNNNKLVGLVRLVGDAGCYCQIVDLCILPGYHETEVYFLIMNGLDSYIRDNLPDSCSINLIADN